LQNTGYNVSEKTQGFLATIHQNGLDPKVLANWLIKGMEDEIFLIIPYDQSPRMVEIELERFKYLAYKGGEEDLAKLRATNERMDESNKMTSIREGYDVSASRGADSAARPKLDTGGFAMARSDLDYIDPSKKYQG